MTLNLWKPPEYTDGFPAETGKSLTSIATALPLTWEAPLLTKQNRANGGPTWVLLSVWEFNLNIEIPSNLLDSGTFGAHDRSMEFLGYSTF